MANRGRGRGRGGGMSMAPEQFGLAKGEALPPQVLQPPLKYPILDFKAPPFQLTNELGYLVQLKRDFSDFMKDSPNNVQAIVVKKDIDRYSDCYNDLMNNKMTYEQRYDWTRMPKELKPTGSKRKGDGSVGPGKKRKEVDIEKRLQQLEKKESTQHSDDEDDENAEEDANDKDPDEIPENEEDADEEMDDGTDYVNNYFDNGEGYDEEDDNLDDGPTYG